MVKPGSTHAIRKCYFQNIFTPKKVYEIVKWRYNVIYGNTFSVIDDKGSEKNYSTDYKRDEEDVWEGADYVGNLQKILEE